jgi:hypothetical protein
MALSVERMVGASGNDADKSKGSARVVGGRRRLWWMGPRRRQAVAAADKGSRVDDALSPSPLLILS